MKRVLVLHSGEAADCGEVEVRGRPVAIRRVGCSADAGRVRTLVAEGDGRYDAIAIEDFPVRLQLGSGEALHDLGRELLDAARRTPVVDGSGVRPFLESWGMRLAEQAHPGIFRKKRVLMVPGLNHTGMTRALARLTRHLRYADPFVYFDFPHLPGVGSSWSLDAVARPTLGLLRKAAPERLRPRSATGVGRRARSQFRWAEVLAGDVSVIRALDPSLLTGKTVVAEAARETDLDELRRRGVRLALTLMPSFDPEQPLGLHSAATVEALLAAGRGDAALSLSEDTYLDIVAELDWRPAVRYLQSEDPSVNRFAFVIHPLNVAAIRRHPLFGWARYAPDSVVERIAALMPPMYVSKISGGASAGTGQRVEGHLIALGATPRQIMKRSAGFTYKRLNKAARMAESLGARLMGLGAFTSVVGDAGVTVARTSPIPITSGNSLTVAATLEAAKQAARLMGFDDLPRRKVMIIGATGSIGSVCARMIAQTIRNVVLVSIEPEKLIELKRLIRAETPGSRVVVATRSAGLVAECDLIICATSGFGQRILDISECKPGAIICDVARPPDITEAEAALRPDVLVVESGEVLIPGEIDFGYDIGLPPSVSYACLAETALLAMEGRFESYTLGRQISVERVKEIYRLFHRHGFRLAGLRSLGRYPTDADLAEKRALAEKLRRDPALMERTRRDAVRILATAPRVSKGVRGRGPAQRDKEARAGNRRSSPGLSRG